MGDEGPVVPCDETIDATGCYLLPGVIDDHVHFRDPGLTQKPILQAKAGQLRQVESTSIMDMPNTSPQTTTTDALNAKFDLMAEKCSVNYSCYFGHNNNYLYWSNWTSIAYAVSSYSWDRAPVICWSINDKPAGIFNSTDLLIATHCEDQGIIKETLKISNQIRSRR